MRLDAGRRCLGGGELGSADDGGSRRQRTRRSGREADQPFGRRPCQTADGDRRSAEALGHPEAQKNYADRADHAQSHATATEAARGTQGMSASPRPLHARTWKPRMLDQLMHDQGPVGRAVLAAEGWLALGAAQAAMEELAALEPVSRTHPAVLHQQARIMVALGRVGEAKEAQRRIQMPDAGTGNQ